MPRLPQMGETLQISRILNHWCYETSKLAGQIAKKIREWLDQSIRRALWGFDD